MVLVQVPWQVLRTTWVAYILCTTTLEKSVNVDHSFWSIIKNFNATKMTNDKNPAPLQNNVQQPAQGNDAIVALGEDGVCRTSAIAQMLRGSGLRPTRQRLSLAQLLFSKGHRHISAELLHEEVRGSGLKVSLATIYNTLHQFTESGLLRAISVDSNRTYFDTNTGDHHHFYYEESETVVDMPSGFVTVDNLPDAPDGMEISRVDVIVRVKKRDTRRYSKDLD